jgi:hypothetical protein
LTRAASAALNAAINGAITALLRHY